MFGLGFTEILLIAVLALLFIGPDKLPDTMKQIAKTFGKVKRAIDDTKSTISQELQVDDLKKEAMMYKEQIESAKSDLSSFKNIAKEDFDEIKKHAQIENSYKPADINDDELFDDLFEEAEEGFKNLDEPKTQEPKTENIKSDEHITKEPQNIESKNEEPIKENPYKQAPTEVAIESNSLSAFKNVKSGDN